ncbi:hypothetical protein M758_UG144500 [Ceratodon purpureus]|nr:hypothetical protein M758_UG144500 [Ceratodon purpureus]
MVPVPKFTLVSLNVRALGQRSEGVWKRHAIRDQFSNMDPIPDVMLLQEHRYIAKDCLDLTFQMEFLGGHSLWNEGLYNASSDRVKGETAILLSKRLNDLTKESGIILVG